MYTQVSIQAQIFQELAETSFQFLHLCFGLPDHFTINLKMGFSLPQNCIFFVTPKCVSITVSSEGVATAEVHL